MKSNTSLVASQIRLQEWALQVKECNNRPQGMKIGTWCQQNNITKANYYYRLRRVREACLDLMDTAKESVPSFVELRSPGEPVVDPTDQSTSNPDLSVAAVLILPNGIRMELLNNASFNFMKTVFEASAYAK